MADTLLFVFGLFDAGALLFLTVYFVITLSDLECDYLNAQQCCSKLNSFVLPELVAHCIYNLLLLIFGFHWVLFLLNAPMAAWQIYKRLYRFFAASCSVFNNSKALAWRFMTIPSGNVGVYDPTEIHNRGMLKSHMKESMIKLGYYLVFFFIYLYCMIVSLLTKDPNVVTGAYGDDTEF